MQSYSRARALYGDPDRRMRLLVELRKRPECECLEVPIILNHMELLHAEQPFHLRPAIDYQYGTRRTGAERANQT